MSEYLALKEFAESANQMAILEALHKNGSMRSAAAAMGINPRTLTRALAKIRERAAQQGYSPEHDMVHAAPKGFAVKGTSTLYDEEGKVVQQWVKTQLDQEQRLKALHDAIFESMSDFKGAARPRKAPAKALPDQMVVYPMGDPHIGMYAWHEETGEDFDTDIARDDLLSAMSRLVKVAPKTERALILNLGDFFHADNYAGETSRSKHKLDTDGRWPKVLQVGCMVMVDLVTMALSKHQEVEVINCIGNHDDHSSVMLSAFLGAYFHNEPRVKVHPTVRKYHYIQFGRVLMAATHGDTVKMRDLAEIMAVDCPEGWGSTDHRYWFTGHIHHVQKHELRGCMVESFRTLAAQDAWHSASGYRSGRDMYAIVMDKQFGEVERYRCDIRMARREA